MTTSSTTQKKSVSSKATQQKDRGALPKKALSAKKISGASAANAAKTPTTQKAKIVEFRFQCDANLREQMNERIKLLRLDRSKVMADFIKEWLKQTDIYLTDASTSKHSKQ